MNRIYRLVWSEAARSLVAVAETARARGKRASGVVRHGSGSTRCFHLKPLAFALASIGVAHAAPPIANQLPTGGQVVAGAAQMAKAGATLTVNQSSARAAINWQTFNVGSAATVKFVQPSTGSVTLNRVLDSNPSQIFGRITAPGQVFLTNPNGVYFAPGASVDVGGLVATTHSISNADFMAGKDRFSRNGATGSVVNDGKLTASLGGYIALLAPEVRNHGVIVAQMGTVALASGEMYELQFAGNNTLASLRVTPSTIKALVENRTAVQAPGGLIILSAQAANRLQGGVVNNSGALEATGLVDNGGVIRLSASDSVTHTGTISADAVPQSRGHGGTVSVIADLANPESKTIVDGSISARGGAQGGNGGFVETSASHVKVGDGARVTTAASMGLTGTWLLDPTDFTIAASGGDITGATLGTNLAGGDVAIASTSGASGTSGDVNVNDAVSWSANKLTLNAQNNINIKANLTGTGTASLALEYGQGAVASGNASDYVLSNGATVTLPAGANFSTKLGSDGATTNYTVITSLGAQGSTTAADLQGMSGSLSTNYALGVNIDAAPTAAWNSGAGFAPVGNLSTQFTGNFAGLGHIIATLTINVSGGTDIALFGATSSGTTVRDVGILNGSVTGATRVGPLVGLNYGTISNSYSTTSASSTAFPVGGLVGRNRGTITNSYATGTVAGGTKNAGGLVGSNYGTITNSYATGAVTGSANQAGGLVGVSYGSTSISNSYATGTVSGANAVGGLVGYVTGGSVTTSYATGTVSGTSRTGGLVGQVVSSGTVTDSYATGNVSGSDLTGGLVGDAISGTITTSYATGTVTGGTNAGGLVGAVNGSALSNSYATGTVSGTTPVGGLIGVVLNSGTVTNSYATGSVSASGTYGGGLIGLISSGSVSNVYATGAVTGATYSGGLVGGNTGGTLSNGYSIFDGLTFTNQPVGAGSSTGTSILGPAQMQTASNFTGFTFTTTAGASGNNWVIVDADGTLNNSGSATGGTYPMLASEYSTTIKNAHQLQLIAMATAGVYALKQDIDAAAAATTHDVWASSTFVPIGTSSSPFTGTLDGNSHTISNLTVNTSRTSAGLFDTTSAATIKNLAFATASITGSNSTGTLAGYVNDSSTVTNVTASDVTVTGGSNGGLIGEANNSTLSQLSVTGTSSTHGGRAGGLISRIFNSTLDSSTSTANVVGAGIHAGGLVGLSQNSTISNSTASGSVTSGQYAVGGLVGLMNYGGSITNSSASGTVTNTSNYGNSRTGGLIGYINGASNTVSGSFATGNVVATNASTVGGLVGRSTGTITSSYATGNVTGASYVGGLVGVNSGTISTSYAVGIVAAETSFGGLVGINASSISNSYWNTDTTSVGVGSGSTVGATGLTTAQMQSQSSFAGFDFVTPVWGFAGGGNNGYPVLCVFTGMCITTVYVEPASGSSIYGSAPIFTYLLVDANNALYLLTNASVTGTALYNSAPTSSSNVGIYLFNYASGLGLTGSGAGHYQLVTWETPTLWTVNPKALTAVASAPNKIYDGTTSASPVLTITGGLVGSETLTTTGTGSFNTKDVATANTVTVNSVTLGNGTNGGLASNYTLAAGQTAAASITPRPLTAGASAPNKVYDGTTSASPTLTITSGLVASEMVTTTGTGTFNTKDVATANLVTVNSVTLTDGANGGLASNYSLTAGETAAASIMPKAVALSATKIYDGTTSLAGAVTVSTGITGEALNYSGATASDANVATAGKYISAITLADGAGGLASNYQLPELGSSTAPVTITSRTVSLSATKVYDGGVDLTGAVTVVTGVAGEALNYADATANDANVATAGKYISTITLGDGTGGLASNYQLPTLDDATAPVAITPRPLTAVASAPNKVYDGTTTASPTLAITGGLVGSETLNVTGTGTFNSKDVATANTVTVNSMTLSDGANGGLASNYSLPAGATAAANIMPKQVTLSASKTYDGTTSLAGAVTVGTGVTGEALGYSGAAASDANVATAGNYIEAIALADGSGRASNYQLPVLNSTNAPVTINPKTVALSATKTYDGTTSLAGAVTVSTGITGEALNYVGATASDANAGTTGNYIDAITLTDGTEGRASNYQLPVLNSTTAPVTINAAALQFVIPPTPPAPSLPAVSSISSPAGGSGISTDTSSSTSAASLGGTASGAAPTTDGSTASTGESGGSTTASSDSSSTSSSSSSSTSKTKTASTSKTKTASTSKTKTASTSKTKAASTSKAKTASAGKASPSRTSAVSTAVQVASISPTLSGSPLISTISSALARGAAPGIRTATSGGGASSTATTRGSSNVAGKPSSTAASSPATARSVQQSLAGSGGARNLSQMVNAKVASAVARGVPARRAAAAGKAYKSALVHQLSRGASPAAAAKAAENAFGAQTAFPASKAPAVSQMRSLAAGGGQQLASRLSSLSGAKSATGSAAFDKSLAVALAKGVSFTNAVKVAQQAVQVAEAAARADSAPQSLFANANIAAQRNAGPLAQASPQLQRALGVMLEKGVSPTEALRRATQVEQEVAAAKRADTSPSAELARGDVRALSGQPAAGTSDKVLSAAIAKGMPVAEAMARAAKVNAFEQRAIQADAKSPLARFSNGETALPKGSPEFDRVVASAIAHGETPQAALASAEHSTASLPPEKPTASSALATGKNLDTVLASHGNSRVFKKVLNNALARGVPIDKALAQAHAAEDRSASHISLPNQVAREAAAGKATLTTEGGKPLPSWLKLDLKTQALVAYDAPPGAFPMKVVVNMGGQSSTITLSENSVRK